MNFETKDLIRWATYVALGVAILMLNGLIYSMPGLFDMITLTGGVSGGFWAGRKSNQLY